jgi:hypothetical protein
MNAPLQISLLNNEENTSIAALHQLSVIESDTTSGSSMFQPIDTSKLSGLFSDYEIQKEEIAQFLQFMEESKMRTLHTLLRASDQFLDMNKMLDPIVVFKYLDARFWQAALDLSDIYQFMSQHDRTQWDKQILSMTTPAFETSTVIPTLIELLNNRRVFLARTADDVFQHLSGDHVTNQPQGFSKRMILAPNFYTPNQSASDIIKGYVHDLRCLVAHFMGRKPHDLRTTKRIFAVLESTPGVWADIDGGSVRIKTHLSGTVHLEIHPDMSWQLNLLLAILYPLALPPKVRQKPKKNINVRPLVNLLLSSGAILAISEMVNPNMTNQQRDHRERPKIKDFSKRTFNGLGGIGYFADVPSKSVMEEVKFILEACGATQCLCENGDICFSFDFDFEPLKNELILCGHIPEHRSYQFYSTTETVAVKAIQWADIKPEHSALEPSAGQAHIAKFMPTNTTCVDISPINCAILKGKGLQAIEADFLTWALTAPLFDRIVMNPPFNNGQAEAHVLAASTLLKPNGCLVAVVPANFLDKQIAPGFKHEWSEVINGAFLHAKTNVSVILIKITRI